MKRTLIRCFMATGLILGGGWQPCPAEDEGTTERPAPRTKLPAAGLPWTVPDLRMKLVYIHSGSFRMGVEHEFKYASPVHPVRITRGFWLGKHEVSQKEYKELIGKNPSTHKGEHHPVETVSWNDAVAFCTALTDREREAGRLPAGHEYRLPTEAEWEFAARRVAEGAADEGKAATTKEVLRRHIEKYGDRTHPVAAGDQTSLGFYGMSGNVWEWCRDWYGEDYYANSPAEDPTGPRSGTLRVTRGGLLVSSFQGINPSAFRDPDPPENVDDFLGFRVALGPSLD